MNDVLDILLTEDARRTPEERRTLEEALAADATLAEAATYWEAFCASLGHRFRQQLPERRLLVCYALDAQGFGDTLDAHEREALAVARPDLEAALEASPALAAIVQQIQHDALAFDALWAQPAPAAPRAFAKDRMARPAGRRRVATWVWRGSALVALVAFAAVLVFVGQRDQRLVTLTAGPADARVVDLADGTQVRLQPGAHLSFHDGDGFDRQVRLQGNAYFDVAHGETPFTIETTTALTTVLGTSFGVQAEAAQTTVVLVSGAVALAARAQEEGRVVLRPGEMSRVADGAPTPPVAVDLTAALSWSGMLVFRATPMAVVARHLSAHFGRPVAVDAALADEAVHGTWPPEATLEAVLQALSTTLGAEVQQTESGLLLVPGTR